MTNDMRVEIGTVSTVERSGEGIIYLAFQKEQGKRYQEKYPILKDYTQEKVMLELVKLITVDDDERLAVFGAKSAEECAKKIVNGTVGRVELTAFLSAKLLTIAKRRSASTATR